MKFNPGFDDSQTINMGDMSAKMKESQNYQVRKCMHNVLILVWLPELDP
jgi:hypothetical protein